MTFTRAVLLAAVLLAIASRASAGTAAIDLDIEEVHCPFLFAEISLVLTTHALQSMAGTPLQRH